MNKLFAIILTLSTIVTASCGDSRISLENQDPVIEKINASQKTVNHGDPVNLSVTAYDPDGDEITFSWTSESGTYDQAAGSEVIWTAPGENGSYILTVTITDGEKQVTDNLVIEVNDNDLDNDGLTDDDETILGTNPNNPDSDNDGVNDGTEVANSWNPNNPDTDNDGLNDGYEVSIGTDPINVDTDGDFIEDGHEVENGTDPLVSSYGTPVIQRIGRDVMFVVVGHDYGDEGANAYDNVRYDEFGHIMHAEDINENLVTINSVDTDTIGNYTVTYKLFDNDGNSAPDIVRTVHVVESHSVYVDAAADCESSDGSMESPFCSLWEAYENSAVGGIINVAEGTYNSGLTIRYSLEFYGGLDRNSWEKTGARSIINNLRISNTVPGHIDIEGFEILSTSSDGMLIDGAGDISISNNIIRGGTATYYPTGIRIFADNLSKVEIFNNRIYGGYNNQSINGWTTGLLIDNYQDDSDSNISVINNYIYGGSDLKTSWGLRIVGNHVALVNNTIEGGDGIETTCGIYAQNSNTLAMVNNSISGGSGAVNSYAIWVQNTTTEFILSHNNLWNASTALIAGNDVPTLNLSVINSGGWTGWNTGTGGNVSVDPEFSNEFRINASSPLKDIGTEPGLIPYNLFGVAQPAPLAYQIDYDGESRPFDNRYDIGMDEFVE